MSLVSTLAKVAIGIAIAKGVSGLAKAGQSGQSAGSGTRYSPQAGGAKGGLGGMMGELLAGGRKTEGAGQTQTGGGLGDLFDQLPEAATKKTTGKNRTNAPTSLDDILAGNVGTQRGGGGLGDVLGGMLGGVTTAGRGVTGASGGGIGDMLGGLLGGSRTGGASTGGGLGDLFGAVLGGAAVGGTSGGLGGLLNKALTGNATAQDEPTAAQELTAGLMLKVMIQAVKCDGALDADEKQKLIGVLGEASQAEMKFVNDELAAPLDIDGLARQIPQGLEAQAYMMSLMAINLDNQTEAQYLDGFAQALELAQDQVNAIHDHVGAPRLYT